jgi:hypothetical protein
VRSCSDSTCQTTLSSSGLTGRSSTPPLIDPIIGASGILDHPLSRAMTVGHASAFSRHKAPELLRNLPPSSEAKGAGKAGCTLHPRSRVQSAQKTHTSIQVQRRHPGFPCAMGYGLLRALPGERLFCHRRHAETSASLDASTAASGPHDFAVRFWRLTSAHAIRVHRISPRVRDVANAPQWMRQAEL